MSSLTNIKFYSKPSWEVLGFFTRDVLKSKFIYDDVTNILRMLLTLNTSSFGKTFDKIQTLTICVSRESIGFNRLVTSILPELFVDSFDAEVVQVPTEHDLQSDLSILAQNDDNNSSPIIEHFQLPEYKNKTSGRNFSLGSAGIVYTDSGSDSEALTEDHQCDEGSSQTRKLESQPLPVVPHPKNKMSAASPCGSKTITYKSITPISFSEPLFENSTKRKRKFLQAVENECHADLIKREKKMEYKKRESNGINGIKVSTVSDRKRNLSTKLLIPSNLQKREDKEKNLQHLPNDEEIERQLTEIFESNSKSKVEDWLKTVPNTQGNIRKADFSLQTILELEDMSNGNSCTSLKTSSEIDEENQIDTVAKMLNKSEDNKSNEFKRSNLKSKCRKMSAIPISTDSSTNSDLPLAVLAARYERVKAKQVDVSQTHQNRQTHLEISENKELVESHSEGVVVDQYQEDVVNVVEEVVIEKVVVDHIGDINNMEQLNDNIFSTKKDESAKEHSLEEQNDMPLLSKSQQKPNGKLYNPGDLSYLQITEQSMTSEDNIVHMEKAKKKLWNVNSRRSQSKKQTLTSENNIVHVEKVKKKPSKVNSWQSKSKRKSHETSHSPDIQLTKSDLLNGTKHSKLSKKSSPVSIIDEFENAMRQERDRKRIKKQRSLLQNKKKPAKVERKESWSSSSMEPFGVAVNEIKKHKDVFKTQHTSKLDRGILNQDSNNNKYINVISNVLIKPAGSSDMNPSVDNCYCKSVVVSTLELVKYLKEYNPQLLKCNEWSEIRNILNSIH